MEDITGELAPKLARDNASTMRSNTILSTDWRCASIRTALAVSRADYCLFLEQDFMMKDPKHFMHTVAAQIDLFKDPLDVVGFWEDSAMTLTRHQYAGKPWDYMSLSRVRFHPAFLLCSRDLINQSSQDFGAGEGYDHFGKFSDELYQMLPFLKGGAKILESIGLLPGRDWEHLAGLTSLLYCKMAGEPIPDEPKLNKYLQQLAELGEY